MRDSGVPPCAYGFDRIPVSSATGVFHRCSACARIATSPAEFPASLLPFRAGANDVGVGHRARAVSSLACIASPISRPIAIRRSIPGRWQSSLSPPLASGVCHKPEAIPSVGRVDGTSRDNGRPAGVVDAFQVSKHSIEPVLANRCRNLLSHEDSGPSGTDEPRKVGPQVPIVSLGFALAGDGERLARRGAGPELAVVGPPSKSGCEGPSADAGEEMALPVSGKVVGLNIHDAPCIDMARRDQAGVDEVAQPLGGVRVEFVVVGSHTALSAGAHCARSSSALSENRTPRSDPKAWTNSRNSPIRRLLNFDVRAPSITVPPLTA